MKPYYSDDTVTLFHGDCLEVMRTLPDASVEAVVTDPPYGLEFMGKGWDSFGGDTRQPFRGEVQTPDNPFGRSTVRYGGTSSLGGKHAEAMRAFGDWCIEWTAECLRVLKPGGHLLAFGGTRTWHRLACAVEDAGFEVRDSIAWLYGSGFPKSLNVTDETGSRTGWGTALKPAFEPIVVGRKPLAGTVAKNVLEHGTGALNIDATRTPTSDSLGGGRISTKSDGWDRPWKHDPEAIAAAHGRGAAAVAKAEELGRWPTNVVLDESQADELDQQSGERTSGILAAHHAREPKDAGILGAYGSAEGERGYGDTGGASRFFPTFRYEAKAPASERPKVDGVAHPTVKPLDLCRWLVRLVTPPGGTVLEPFAGSGTTVEACVIEGFKCVAIEKTDEYLPLTVARIHRRRDPVAAIKLAGDDLGLFDLGDAS